MREREIPKIPYFVSREVCDFLSVFGTSQHVLLGCLLMGGDKTRLWCERSGFESTVRHQCVPKQDT